jgi:hypothetical protein
MKAILKFRFLLIAENFTDSVVRALTVDSDRLYMCRLPPVRKYTCLKDRTITRVLPKLV